MKELTRVITARITIIENYEDDIPAKETVKNQLLCDMMADDVEVLKVQDFVREVTE